MDKSTTLFYAWPALELAIERLRAIQDAQGFAKGTKILSAEKPFLKCTFGKPASTNENLLLKSFLKT